MYSQIQKRYRILRWSSQGIVFVLPSTREVLLNVTNELYETDVYNVMGIIKGSTYPGKLSHSTRECQLSRITLTLVLNFSTLYSFNKPTKNWNKWEKILNLWQRWDWISRTPYNLITLVQPTALRGQTRALPGKSWCYAAASEHLIKQRNVFDSHERNYIVIGVDTEIFPWNSIHATN